MAMNNIFFYHLPIVNHTCSYRPVASFCSSLPEMVERLNNLLDSEGW